MTSSLGKTSQPDSEQKSAAPSISLPKGGGAIRGIGEKFGANPVTGTGSMSVPIATSPGRSGFAPELALSYDSGAGNGPFGFGWGLSLPAITRKTDKGLPQYRDAEESDVFLLSGAEDLVPVLKNGSRFEDDTTFPDYTIHRFQPRIEGLFARIERWTRRSDGDVHWRSISKDNILTIYGKDNQSRIVDPENAKRIFSWLICETRDDKGNAVLYGYKEEDGLDVDLTSSCERNRGGRDDPRRAANHYLKHIYYGNRTPLLDNDGKRPLLLSEVQGQNAGWLFEVVFDYGEHDADVPKPDDSGHWSFRNDPFSTYRAGFEIRTTRLCQRVLMFHHFPDEEGVGNDCLVRSTDFTYSHEQDPASVRNPVYTFLRGVTQTGYKRDGNGYLKDNLPPVEFEYTQPIVQDAVEEVDSESLENLPIGVDGTAYQWTDLHGEGIPGILTEQADAWFYKRNLSPIGKHPVEFAPLERVATKPNLSLATGAQFMDLAGDGQLDLVVLDDPTPGLFEHDTEEGWQSFRPFSSRLNRDTRDPNIKFVDLDGDGHADVFITENDAFIWHRSLAEEGFGPAHRVAKALDEEKGPRLIFADGTQSIYLADLSGDGLTDLVRMRNGEICYWPNLGYGRFGNKISMDHASNFDHPDQFDHKRIRLADIDGTGTTDIIYLHRDGVRLYFNQSGNSWSEPQILNVFPRVDDLVSIVPADLLGNGTACLVWSSPLPGDTQCPMRYVNLMGGKKPHLLVKTINNLGAETQVQYAPSTKFYLQDKYDGIPWITKLPFPVHVIERVETFDHISRNRFVTRYAYHHGYFDGEEREFRGFGMVEQWDTEELAVLTGDDTLPEETNINASSHVPPVHTKTWFHTGVFLGSDHISDFYAGLLNVHDKGEYYREPGLNDAQAHALLLKDTVLPDDLTIDEAREACRALKGFMLRQEVYALDGTPKEPFPYTVTEQNYSISLVQPRKENRHAVFFTHPCEAINYHYERDPSDPRIQHALTLEVDDFGNVLKEAAIGYGRRKIIRVVDDEVGVTETPNPALEELDPVDRAKQTQTLITYSENCVTKAIDDSIKKLDGSVKYPYDYRAPLPCETRTYELTGFKPENGAARFSFDEWTLNGFALPLSATEIQYEKTADMVSKQKRLIEHVRTLYRQDDLIAFLPFGEVESLALPGETYKLAFTQSLLDQIYKRPHEGRPDEKLLPDNVAEVLAIDSPGTEITGRGGYLKLDDDDRWWIPSGRVFFSLDKGDTPAMEIVHARQHFFTPHRYLDPFGNSATVTFDYDLLIRETTDALENTTSADNDFRILQPKQMTGPNGNRTAVAFDALGMVVATAVMGKEGETNPVNIGDTLDDPTTRLEYELFIWKDHGQPNFVHTFAREQHGVGNPRWQQSYLYSDGFGRELQTKIQAEPGDAAQRDPTTATPYKPGRLLQDADAQLVLAHTVQRWVGTGRTIYNNKGKPVKQYEPFFSSTPLYEDETELVETGVTPVIFYDPMGRVVATLHPNHTFEKVVFDPWQQESWDVNDTVAISKPWDAEQEEHVSGYFARLLEGDTDGYQSWFDQRKDEQLGKAERAAAIKAAKHADTPSVAHLDSLGRTFLTLEHNRFERDGSTVNEKYKTRVDLDIEGNQIAVIDHLGRTVMAYEYDILGSQVKQLSMDAGERWSLNNVTGNIIYAWDSRDHRFRSNYDQLQRVTHLWVRTGNDSNEVLAERTIYGEKHPQAEALNLRGRVWLQLDGAGLVKSGGVNLDTQQQEAFDFKGNPLRGDRRLTNKYKTRPDWKGFETALSADPLDPDNIESELATSLEDDTFTSATTYDALNRVVTQTTPDGSVTRPVYNEANLLEEVFVSLKGSADKAFVKNIDYDAKGQRTLIEYGNGVTTTYEYDPLTFRLAYLLTIRGLKTAQECSPVFDPRTCEDPPALCSRLSSNKCILQNLSYTYDPAGNITHIRDDAQQIIYFKNQRVEPSCDYFYDAIYRLIEARGREHLGQTGGQLIPPVPTSPTDAPRVGLQHPGDGRAMGKYTEWYEYDEVGNILSMRHHGSDPNKGWTRCYQYAMDSNRLLSTGSRNEPGFDCPEQHADYPVYSEIYTYDAHGNMTKMPHLPLMEWDFEDQLRAISKQEVNNSGTPETTYYVYDAAGQRIRKVTENYAQAGDTPTRKEERIYLGGFEVFRKYDSHESVELKRETLHVMDDQQRITMVETKTIDTNNDSSPTQLIRYQFGNHLGSASLELDDEGIIISYEEYYPYGSPSYQAVDKNIKAAAKRYRYTRKERDEETGLYYHGVRYYACWLGRWTAADPAGTVDGTNLYAYVRGSPVVLSDPSGARSWEEGCSQQERQPLPHGTHAPVALRPNHFTAEDLQPAPTSEPPSGSGIVFPKGSKLMIERSSLVPEPTIEFPTEPPTPAKLKAQVAVQFPGQKDPDLKRAEALPQVREFESTGSWLGNELLGGAYSAYNVLSAGVNTFTVGVELPGWAARQAGVSEKNVRDMQGFLRLTPVAANRLPSALGSVLKSSRATVGSWHKAKQAEWGWRKARPRFAAHMEDAGEPLLYGEEVHHWLIPQGGWGRRIPNYIKNRDWNLMRAPSEVRDIHSRAISSWHAAIHGKASYDFPQGLRLHQRLRHGSPAWARRTAIGIPATAGLSTWIWDRE